MKDLPRIHALPAQRTSYDVLVVGAGMTGAVAARHLAEAGYTVLLIDQRTHLGGNCHDVEDAHGIRIHPYGPHIFHTSRQSVMDFLGKFTQWRPYEHRVRALVQHRLIPLPFNLTSLQMCFGREAPALEAKLRECFGEGAHIPILELRRRGSEELQELADFIYAHVFAGYSQKQWGLSPDALDPAVTARVPVRISHDDRYFTDAFQCMPAAGFTTLFQRMLEHPRITLRLNTPYSALGNQQGRPEQQETGWKYGLYTGALDEFFGYSLGSLPYRSTDLCFEHHAQQRHLPTGVLNYPDAHTPWTRITEYKTLTGQQAEGTTLSLEFPRAHEPGITDPSYPVLTGESAALLRDYQALAAAQAPDLLFAGRLGAFRYYNMDDAVLAGMDAAHTILHRLKGS